MMHTVAVGPPPLLSIVVPTRNRACYAVPAIRAILGNPRRDFELIVQDNSDDRELERQLDWALGDERLRYAYNPVRRSGVDNYNDALAKAVGEYVTMLGDDDAVNPELLAAVDWARAQGLDCLITSRPAQYWWPDIHFRLLGDSGAGTLDLAEFTGEVSYPDPQEQLWRCVREAARGLCDLPRTYYGVVRRECLEQLRERTGAYCRVSPDMSMAVGLADCVARMAKIDYPLFLPGSSAKSTAGMGTRGQHVGRLEDQPHLPEECLRNWSDLVPRYFSGPTIWAEACVQTLRAAGRDDVLREFNLPLLYAGCLVFNPGWWRVAVKGFGHARRAVGKSVAWGSLGVGACYLSTWLLRAHSLVRNLTKSSRVSTTRTVRGVNDVETGLLKLMESLQAAGLTLDRFLPGAVAIGEKTTVGASRGSS